MTLKEAVERFNRGEAVREPSSEETGIRKWFETSSEAVREELAQATKSASIRVRYGFPEHLCLSDGSRWAVHVSRPRVAEFIHGSADGWRNL
jgi:hypothetical protein